MSALATKTSILGPINPIGDPGTGFPEDPLASPESLFNRGINSRSNLDDIFTDEDPLSNPFPGNRKHSRRSLLGYRNTEITRYEDTI